MNKKYIIFYNEKDVVNYLRKNGCKIYNEASDDYIIEEAFSQNWICQEYFNKTNNYQLTK